jgi:mannosylfructose-phosphate synthase
MDPKTSSRIMMISTHGYVSASPEFGKPDTGGQVVYVLELSKWLTKLGSKVDIYTRQFENQPQIESVLGDAVRIIRLPCGGPDFLPKEWLCESIPEWVDHTLRYIRTNELIYDLINSHYWDAGLAGQLLARQLSVPHFHTPHSIGSWKRENMPGSEEELERKYNFQRRISSEAKIYAACAQGIATTPSQREILTGPPYHVAPEKVGLIPAGYDDSRFFPVAESSKQIIKRQLGLEGRIVLAIGRLARNKGYDLLIRAMRPVCERLPDAKLVLAIGSNSLNADEQRQLSELKTLATSLGLSERVDFRGYIPDDELPDMYRAADVFALSSRYEPFGMTAVEAMACGVSTIVTTEGGLWEQVQWGVETLYANPNDPEAFGHSILDVLQYPEVAQQLALHGSIKARSSFTWSSVAQDFLRLAQESCPPQPTHLKSPHPKALTSSRNGATEETRL